MKRIRSWRGEAGDAWQASKKSGVPVKTEEAVVAAGRVGDLADPLSDLWRGVLAHPKDRLGLVDDDDEPAAGGLDDR